MEFDLTKAGLAWLEDSAAGQAVRMTPHLYPVLESLHILGIALLVGTVIAVDLRLLEAARNVVPVTLVTRYLLPVSHVGFALAALTGLAMFAGIATSVVASAAAPWKVGLIGVAGLNIAVFHFGIYRRVGAWNVGCATPVRAKIAAIVSGVSWTGVIVAGRFLAY